MNADPDALARRLVPDVLWDIAAPMIPSTKWRAQGGGRQRVPDRAVLAAVLFVLSSGCAWRALPASFGVAVATAHRRFVEWDEVDLWAKMDERVPAAGDDELVRWTGAIVRAAASRRRGETRPAGT